MHQGPRTEARQDYLKIILDLKTKAVDGNRFISNKDIAAAFHVQPPSVTEILAKLEAAGLVEWQRRKGARLTQKGLRHAMKVRDAHAIAESFLATVLKASDPVMNQRIACKMEHILVDEPWLATIMEASIEENKHDKQRVTGMAGPPNRNDSR